MARLYWQSVGGGMTFRQGEGGLFSQTDDTEISEFATTRVEGQWVRSWGTQHDPAFDVAEVDLEYSQADDSSRAMSASVVMTAADQGRFVLVWGPHEWTADFAVAR